MKVFKNMNSSVAIIRTKYEYDGKYNAIIEVAIPHDILYSLKRPIDIEIAGVRLNCMWDGRTPRKIRGEKYGVREILIMDKNNWEQVKIEVEQAVETVINELCRLSEILRKAIKEMPQEEEIFCPLIIE